jgi:DNA-binding response OmpR family regulator
MSVASVIPLDFVDAPQARPQIVVIDDEPVMRELLTLHLRNNGYGVRAAEDAIVGGHLVLREKPDLIIVDVQMPYMNGYEFVSALKATQLRGTSPSYS